MKKLRSNQTNESSFKKTGPKCMEGKTETDRGKLPGTITPMVI